MKDKIAVSIARSLTRVVAIIATHNEAAARELAAREAETLNEFLGYKFIDWGPEEEFHAPLRDKTHRREAAGGVTCTEVEICRVERPPTLGDLTPTLE